MNNVTTLGVLLLAAVLEAGGDALVRKGLHAPALARLAFLLSGAVVLFVYGCTVNAPPWDFGRLLGVYIALFFVVAQMMSWLIFGQPPSGRVLVGGACIVAGGLIISG